MKKTFTFKNDGKEYKVCVKVKSPVLDIYVWVLAYPNNKIFKYKYLGSIRRGIDIFPTIKQAIDNGVNDIIETYKTKIERYEKIKFFKENH